MQGDLQVRTIPTDRQNVLVPKQMEVEVVGEEDQAQEMLARLFQEESKPVWG